MKKILCSVVTGFLLSLPCLADAASTSIGVVRQQTLYQESKVGIAAIAWLGEMQTDAQTIFATLQAEKAAADEAGDEAAQTDIQVRTQALLYSLQRVMSAEQERIFGLMENLVNRSAARYREENGLTAILVSDNTLAFDASADVTQGILALMDKETVDFGPKPDFQAPAEAPAEPGAR